MLPLDNAAGEAAEGRCTGEGRERTRGLWKGVHCPEWACGSCPFRTNWANRQFCKRGGRPKPAKEGKRADKWAGWKDAAAGEGRAGRRRGKSEDGARSRSASVRGGGAERCDESEDSEASSISQILWEIE